MPPPNHWLVRLLRKFLSGAISFTRHTAQRWLYTLWSILSRRFQGRTSFDKSSSPPGISAGSSTTETIHYELHKADDSTKDTTVCPSMQPRSGSPDIQENRNVSSPATSSSLDGQNTVQMMLESDVRNSSDNFSITSRRRSIVISPAPPSITRRERSRERLAQSRPYSYGGRSASHSSRNNYELNSYSTTSHQQQPHSPRESSSDFSSRDSSDSINWDIPIGPERPFTIPNVAVPVRETGRLYQTVPEWTARYDRNVLIPMTESKYNVQPLQVDFTYEGPLPLGWTPLTHPVGALYFHNRDHNIFTDAYLYDPDVLLHIIFFIKQIDKMKYGKPIPSNVELVLELSTEDEEFAINNLLYEVQGLSSAAHLKHEIESQYCWFSFASRGYYNDIIDELRETLLYFSGDSITSHISTTPYSFEDLSKMLSLLDQVKLGKWHGHSATFIGRLMHTFAHHKFLEFHGQRGAHLCWDQSVHEIGSPKRSLLITLLSPILFRAPDVHLKALGDIWVDRVICYVPWVEFMTKLTNDWKGFTLFAMVLLNANVAFLAIQSVDTNKPNRSATQLASYISIVASVGCVILGLLLDRQNRTNDRKSVQATCRFLMLHPVIGSETLAILYSLPYALLVWGTLAFLVAFSFNCFHDTDIPTRSIVGASSVTIYIFIAWCIWTAWGSEASEDDRISTLFTKVFESCKATLHVSKLQIMQQIMQLKRQRLPTINTIFRRSTDPTVTVRV